MVSQLSVRLPGVLARGEEQFSPLDDILARSVYSPTYAGNKFRANAEVKAAVESVGMAVEHADRVQLVGASFGGDLVPFVVQSLPDEVKSRLKVIVVDAPAGASTLKALPSWSAGFMVSPFGRLATPIGLIRIPPKPDEITAPRSGRQLDGETWKRYVIQRARRELKGHSARQWRSQVALMIKMERDGSLAKACESLHGLDVTYMACVGKGNGVVAQPAAVQWWVTHVPGLKVMEVDATHCGFLQNLPEFAAAFRDILKS